MQALKTLSYMAFAVGISLLLVRVKDEYDLAASYDPKTIDLIMALICYSILICVAYFVQPDIPRK